MVTRNTRDLLHDVSLAIEPGRLTAIVGPNGAGKSTLLRVLTGEIRPSQGIALIDGQDMRHIATARLAARRAVVSQQTTLAFSFTVLDVVMLGATVPAFGISDPAARMSARSAIAAVGLSGFENRLLPELSGGERQRVHIARALCQLALAPRTNEQPVALLLDEPTASLDLRYQKSVLDVIRQQARDGRAVLLVIHDLNLAAAYADEIVLMSKGQIAARGQPKDILNETTLSDVYGCRLRVVRPNDCDHPIVLPVSMEWNETIGTATK